MSKHDTTLVQKGRGSDAAIRSVNVPVQRASTIVFDNFAEFEKAEAGKLSKPSYGTYGNQTTEALLELVRELEGADDAILLPSGLAAVTTPLLALLNAGDHLLMVDSVYGPTRRFCDRELARLGIETTYYDPEIGDGISKLIKDNTKVIFLESPGSLTFEVQDIPAIVAEAQKHNIVVMADTTWATPLYFKPFDHGIDVAIQAATKYQCGHSDVILGTVTFRKELAADIRRCWGNLGTCASADDAYLLLRGMRTMSVRLERQQASMMQVVAWLKTREEVEQILCPQLPEDKGHALWKQTMTGGAALFGFTLKESNRDKIAAMCDAPGAFLARL